MYVTIHIGTWVFPLLLTIALFSWAKVRDIQYRRRRIHNYGMPAPHMDLEGFVRWTVAVVVSLAAWLAWSML